MILCESDMGVRQPLDRRASKTVLEALKSALGDGGLAYLEPPTRLAGGYSSEIYGLRLAAGDAVSAEFVLRIMRDDGAAAREVGIQSAVWALGFPVPRIVFAGGSGDGLGRPFSVMERLRGRPALSVSNPFALPGTLRRIPVLLGRVMAQLHSLDAAPVAARLREAGVPSSDLGIDAVLRDVSSQLGGVDPPSVASGFGRLSERRPPAGRAVVCHADLHALNLLVADGEVTGVLDWEIATLAEAQFDVARTALILRMVPGKMSPLGRRVVQRLGNRSASRFLAAYRERQSLDTGLLDWHEALHCLRLIVMLLAARAGAGDASPDVVNAWGPCLPRLQDRLASLSGIRVPHDD